MQKNRNCYFTNQWIKYNKYLGKDLTKVRKEVGSKRLRLQRTAFLKKISAELCWVTHPLKSKWCGHHRRHHLSSLRAPFLKPYSRSGLPVAWISEFTTDRSLGSPLFELYHKSVLPFIPMIFFSFLCRAHLKRKFDRHTSISFTLGAYAKYWRLGQTNYSVV